MDSSPSSIADNFETNHSLVFWYVRLKKLSLLVFISIASTFPDLKTVLIEQLKFSQVKKLRLVIYLGKATCKLSNFDV